MTGARLWSSALILEWDPILTFARRRSELLDWYEENLTPKAFIDEEDIVGVTVGSLQHRVNTGRNSLVLQQVTTERLPSSVARTIEGTLNTMRPQNIRVSGFRALISVPVDLDFDEVRESLAQRAVRFNLSERVPPTFRASDVAILADIEDELGPLQVEFGVVNAQQLRERLRQDVRGRTLKFGAQHVLPADPRESELPPCSVFGEVLIFQPSTTGLTSANEILAAREGFVSKATGVVRELAAGL